MEPRSLHFCTLVKSENEGWEIVLRPSLRVAVNTHLALLYPQLREKEQSGKTSLQCIQVCLIHSFHRWHSHYQNPVFPKVPSEVSLFNEVLPSKGVP